MVSDSTRRSALRSGTALLAGLAGCSGTFGGSEEPDDPDAGTDSYGILLQNRTTESHSFGVVAEPIDGDVVFDDSAEVEGESEHEWDSVLTEDGMYQLRASLDGWEDSNLFTDSNYVDVGGESAPDYPNVVVRAFRDEYYDRTETFVRVLATERERKQPRADD
jgi:hypothetical protein